MTLKKESKELLINERIRERLDRSTVMNLVIRSKRTAFFHIFGLYLAFLSSPIWEDHRWICVVMLMIMSLTAVAASVLSSRTWIARFKTTHWMVGFSVAKLIQLSLWSGWLCLNILMTGLSHSTYVAALMISGVCTAGILTLSSNRALVILVIIIMLFPATASFLWLGGRDASILASIFGIMTLFLISMVNRVHQDQQEALINREMAEQNGKVVEGILNSIPGLVSCVDHSLHYVWTNRRLNEQFGLNVSGEVKSLGGLNVNEPFPDQVRHFIASGKSEEQFEFEMNFPAGKRWMKVFLSSFREMGEGRVLIVAYDIHAAKLVELELIKQKSALIESAKLATLGEMSAGIAHEVNNPLSVMLGRAEIMKNELQEGRVVPQMLLEGLDKIIRSSERIAKIIRGLRSFSRNGENDPFETIGVEKLLNDVLDFSRERFKLRSIGIRIKVEPELKIECRATQIEQVFLNLLSNSYDAISSEEGSWIEIEAKSFGARVIITFTDSGSGIPSQIVEKIMQPFFTTKEVGKGTGLGLSISLGIIHSHSGEFYYDADSPNTRFVISMPKNNTKKKSG